MSEHIEYQMAQMRAIQEKCFDENDQLRQRVMELEINYSNAQDELDKRNEAIKEMSEQITLLQQTIQFINKKIQKPKQKKSKKKIKLNDKSFNDLEKTNVNK